MLKFGKSTSINELSKCAIFIHFQQQTIQLPEGINTYIVMFIDIFWIYHQTNQNVGYILDIKNQEKKKTQKMNRGWIYFGYKK